MVDQEEASVNSGLARGLSAGALALALAGAACSSAATGQDAGECTRPQTPTLTLAAYSTPREVYGKIIPAFQEKWKAEHDDQQVIFQESYGASTTQTQNIVGGFEADIAALSLAPDMDVIVDEGLITHDWTAAKDN